MFLTYLTVLSFKGNVAYKKPVLLSSSTGARGDYVTDGDKSVDFSKCSTTDIKEDNPFMEVDLLAPYPVKEVRILARSDGRFITLLVTFQMTCKYGYMHV